MRVFVSADMEGVTGVAAPEDVEKGAPGYGRGQELLHGDVNAAVEGAFAAGADGVVVNDSHWTMTNLERADLHEDARLIRGNTKPRSMCQGLSADHAVALLVGYHAMAGTPGAVLNHTFLAYELTELRVDGEPVGELGWNARLAGSLGVPVGLVTGDEATVAEARDELGDAPETVAVKAGIDRFSADCRPGALTRPEVRSAAERAVDHAIAGGYDPLATEGPHEIEAEWAATNHAHAAATAPGVDRVAARTTAVGAGDYVTAYEASVGMLRAGAAGTDDSYG